MRLRVKEKEKENENQKNENESESENEEEKEKLGGNAWKEIEIKTENEKLGDEVQSSKVVMKGEILFGVIMKQKCGDSKRGGDLLGGSSESI